MRYRYIVCTLYLVICTLHLNSQRKLDHSDTMMILGVKLYKSGDIIHSTPYLDTCISLNPQNDECRFYRAKCAYDSKDFNLAERIFKSVLALAPRDGVSWNMLGLCFQELKHYDSAEFCFKNAVNINPKESRFFANWGKNEYLQKKYEHAEQLYSTAKFLDPNYSNHIIGHAEVLNKLGRKEEALSELNDAKEAFPSDLKVQDKLKEIKGQSIYIWYLIGLFLVLTSWLIYRKK